MEKYTFWSMASEENAETDGSFYNVFSQSVFVEARQNTISEEL